MRIRILYIKSTCENFINVLLRSYWDKNYYINYGKFIDDNINLPTADKNIRERLEEFSSKQMKYISN